MSTLNAKIEEAKKSYSQSKSQLSSAFANIPEDRIHWSPSPTARTSIEIVAHCAIVVKFIHDQMDGTPSPYQSTAEADAAFRELEQQFQSREQVIGFLNEVSAKYLTWLDELTPERLESMAPLPFGGGMRPIEAWLKATPMHTRGHAAQIEYIQTILGDRDWHRS